MALGDCLGSVYRSGCAEVDVAIADVALPGHILLSPAGDALDMQCLLHEIATGLAAVGLTG